MKFRILTTIFGLFALLNACTKKTISSDAPLPIVYKPSVIVPTQTGLLYSYDAETGLKNWEFNAGTTISCTPVMDASENIYFGAESGKIYAIDGKTGKQKWNTALPGYSSSSPCFGADGNIYVGADSLYCLNANGTKLWHASLNGANIKTAPTYDNGLVYVTSGSKLFCFDANTSILAIKWTYDAGGSTFLGSPTLRDGKVFAGMENGDVKCLDAATGALVWSYKCKDQVTATAMVRDDMVIIGSYDDTLRCIDAVAGTDAIRWKTNLAGSISSSATIDVAKETVYVGSNDFNLYAINHVNGNIRWKYPTGSIIKSSPVLYGNNIYFTSYDKYLYAVDITSGKLLWKTNTNSVNTGLQSPIVNATNSTTYYPTISGNSIH